MVVKQHGDDSQLSNRHEVPGYGKARGPGGHKMPKEIHEAKSLGMDLRCCENATAIIQSNHECRQTFTLSSSSLNQITLPFCGWVYLLEKVLSNLLIVTGLGKCGEYHCIQQIFAALTKFSPMEKQYGSGHNVCVG